MVQILALLSEPVEIDFGGPPWWVLALAALAGPAILAGAAIYAARKAAATATANHRQDIQEAARRQTEELAHSARLHEERLAHNLELRALQLREDRLLQARAEVRDTLDSVLATAIRGMQTAVELRNHIVYRSALSEEVEAAETEDDRLAALERYAVELEEGPFERLEALLDENFAADARLRLRFGNDHPIPRAFRAWSDAVENTAIGAGPEVQPRDLQRFDERFANASGEWNAFIDLANEWISADEAREHRDGDAAENAAASDAFDGID